MMKRVGCKPPYWNSTSSLELCSEQQQLFGLKDLYYNATSTCDKDKFCTIARPCRSLERVNYYVSDLEMPADVIKHRLFNETVGVALDFTDSTYKEVKHVPGMDAQALIGKLHSYAIPI